MVNGPWARYHSFIFFLQFKIKHQSNDKLNLIVKIISKQFQETTACWCLCIQGLEYIKYSRSTGLGVSKLPKLWICLACQKKIILHCTHLSRLHLQLGGRKGEMECGLKGKPPFIRTSGIWVSGDLSWHITQGLVLDIHMITSLFFMNLCFLNSLGDLRVINQEYYLEVIAHIETNNKITLPSQAYCLGFSQFPG